MQPLSKREIIAKIREHFTKPGAQFGYASEYGETFEEAELGNGVCVYRGDADPHSEIRCAMGVLVPDELYSPAMESELAGSLLDGRMAYDDIAEEDVQLPSLRHLFAENVTGDFLRACQKAHDDTANEEGGTIETFLERLDGVADFYGA